MRREYPPCGLRARILKWFDDNPGEELTRQDVAVRFDAKMKTADQTLSRMRVLGELEPAHVWRKPARPKSKA